MTTTINTSTNAGLIAGTSAPVGTGLHAGASVTLARACSGGANGNRGAHDVALEFLFGSLSGALCLCLGAALDALGLWWTLTWPRNGHRSRTNTPTNTSLSAGTSVRVGTSVLGGARACAAGRSGTATTNGNGGAYKRGTADGAAGETEPQDPRKRRSEGERLCEREPRHGETTEWPSRLLVSGQGACRHRPGASAPGPYRPTLAAAPHPHDGSSPSATVATSAEYTACS
ncbi:hypothetical protein GCM10023191_063400 [Actinoallomurus oryzae]|uniref:Uncharacterized protein n=1 Tax=Actinoallomurus oryzae TaxID=502180 RepID=A0ABP8QQI0_9ACTN